MFDAYILVGGKSSRMKANKALLKLGERTFAERAVSAVCEIAENRVSFVVARQNDETNWLLPEKIPQVADVFPKRAALGGIYTALADAKSEWTIVLACDFPFVTKDLFARFAEIAKISSRKIEAIASVQPDGRAQPLCALYRTESCLKIAAQLLKSGDTLPARRLLETATTRWLHFDELKDLRQSERFFFNVNTPEDFLSAQNFYRETL